MDDPGATCPCWRYRVEKVYDDGNVIPRGHFGQEMQRFRFRMLCCAVLCLNLCLLFTIRVCIRFCTDGRPKEATGWCRLNRIISDVPLLEANAVIRRVSGRSGVL
jgi:hypothetical protein